MDDNKNKSFSGDAGNNGGGNGKKKKSSKKKKHPGAYRDNRISGSYPEKNIDTDVKEIKQYIKETEVKKDIRTADSDFKKKSAKSNKGGKGRRPQIHDGFDDIKMKPRYVVVDNDDRDDSVDAGVQENDTRAVNPGVTIGRNAVRELLRSGRAIDKIYVKSGSREGSVVVIVAEAISRGIPIVETDQNKLDRIADGGNHQGVVAMAAGKEYSTVDDILAIAAARGEKPLIVVSDGIEDPHNLGALIRCAECAGAHGIIIPKRRAVGLTPVVVKCSAGAVEHMAVARVTNLATTLKELKEAGIWIFAAEAGGEAYYDADFDLPTAIVFGSEGDGVSRLVKERSDFNVSIPMYGLVNSLNVSTAASVILCHAARVRHGKA